MSLRTRPILLVTACFWGCAFAAGCGGSSLAFPYDRDLVWKATVAHSIAWRPERIQEGIYRIGGLWRSPDGREVRYEITVDPDWNLLAGWPSSRVCVTVEQVAPKKIRLRDTEEEFLARLQVLVEEYASRSRRP